MIGKSPKLIRGSRWLHNMSAPPRMQIVIRPLGRKCETAAKGTGPLLGTVDLEAAKGDGLSYLLRLVTEITGGPGPLDPEFLEATSEARVDRVLETALSLNPKALGLPPFALAVAGSRESGDAIGDPRLVLALLTRLSGHLFVARRPPHLLKLEQLPEILAFHRLMAGRLT